MVLPLYEEAPSPIEVKAPPFLSSLWPGQGPWLVWSVSPGKNYTVQFKNSVHDPAWQALNGSINVLGSQAYLNDLPVGAGPRLYRVVAY